MKLLLFSANESKLGWFKDQSLKHTLKEHMLCMSENIVPVYSKSIDLLLLPIEHDTKEYTQCEMLWFEPVNLG